MSKCNLDFQKRILNYSEMYFIEFGDNFKDIQQLNDYLSKELDVTDFSLQNLYSDFSDENKVSLSEIFENYTGEDIVPLLNISSEQIELTKNNIDCDFLSAEVTDLFHTLPHAKAYFDRDLHSKVITALKVGWGNYDTYINSNSELNKSIAELKNILFDNIQKVLKSNGIISNEFKLLDSDGNVIDYQHYKSVIKLINDFFFNSGRYDVVKKLNRNVPNLKDDLESNKHIYDAYNSAIILVNFDTILNKEFGDKVKIDIKRFNNLTSTNSKDLKYISKVKGINTEYWKNDTHDSESVEHGEDSTTKDIVSIIPQYDKKGVKTSSYLEMKDFYLFASILSDFELKNGINLKESTDSFKFFNENPSESLHWYINNIIQSFNTNKYPELRESFKNNIEFVTSLNEFFNSKDLNINVKEANSEGHTISDILSQIINNSYGATYLKYNVDTHTYETQQMSQFNSNNIQVQNATFSSIIRNINKQNFYELPKIFNDLDLNDNILEISAYDKIKIGSFIRSRTGISVNKNTFNLIVEDLLRNDAKVTKLGKVSVADFRGSLIELLNQIKKDSNQIKILLKDPKFREAINYETINDSTIGVHISNILSNKLYTSIKDSYLQSYIIKPIMNIETLSGEKLPTFKLATLTYKDTELLEKQRLYQKSNKDSYYKSILLESVLIGTGTKLEVTNGDVNKAAVKLNVAEQQISSLQYDFLENLISSNNAVSIMLGNYSDKNTVLTKIFRGDAKYNGNEIVKMSDSDLLEVVRNQSLNYYRDLTDSIFSDYKELFDTLGIKNIMGTNFNVNASEINRILNDVDILKLQKDYEKIRLKNPKSYKKLTFVEELHYSTYNVDGSKKIYLNQTILDNYRIFSNGDYFKTFVRKQEESLIKKYKEFFKEEKLILSNYENVDKYLDRLNINKEEYFPTISEEGHLNPLLKKWMWVNALFRNEYMYLSAKGEYMHPHKNSELAYRGNSSEVNFDKYFEENSGRLASMAKRNVLFTATIEVPIRKTKFGVPENVNIAVLKDHESPVFNYVGLQKKQEVHDGSSMIDAVYSKMIDSSYPGKGYSGTKKQFATFVTQFGVTIKKDAESVITNSKIRNSENSIIKLGDKKKQMLSIPINFYSGQFNFEDNSSNYYYNYLGDIYRINKISIEDNNITVNLSIKTKDGFISFKNVTEKFNNLYDIWNLIGGAYSTDEDGNFNEGSNDLLYEIVTTQDIEGRYVLKDHIIHILSNKSAIKAGASNVNNSSSWKNSSELLYSTYENRFMGPQLDANHSADESKIKEVTQVISALAQNSSTSELAKEAYDGIYKVIEASMKPYLKYLINGSQNVDKDKLYSHISQKFINTVLNTEGTSLSKTLIQSFSKDSKIPFSHPHFFGSFVKDVIVRMNNEFITRYYSGTGAILIPSHGIYQVYDLPIRDSEGNITGYTQASQEDLLKESLVWFKSLDIKPEVFSNKNILDLYLQNKLEPEDTTWDKIQLGDTVLVDGSEILLETPDLYYKYKENKTIAPVKKVLNTPRDLKPSEITFTINGVTNNLFDLEPIKLRYQLGKGTVDKDFIKNICKFFEVENNSKNFSKILTSWTQRMLELLDEGVVMKNIFSEEFTKDGVTNFELYFGKDKLTNSFSEVRDHYLLKNSLPIENYKFNAAELVLPDLYATRFNRGSKNSMYEINTKKELFFRESLVNDYKVNSDEKNNDIKLIISETESPIYIRFVNDISKYKNSFPIKGINTKLDQSLENKWFRINQFGEPIYEIVDPEHMRVINDNGKEVIVIKAYSTQNNVNSEVKSFKSNLRNLIESFGPNIKTFVPIMGNNIKFKKGDKLLKLNWFTLKLFSEITGVKSTDFKASPSWLNDNIDIILNKLSKKKYSSWEKSKEFVAARIPSQSMQSFMQMKNIAYFNTESNDAYVSIWQIWLQGSDFDIDKAYILGSHFDKKGNFQSWSNVSEFSTKEQLDSLEKLPLPSEIEAVLNYKDGVDITEPFLELANILNSLDLYESSNIMRDVLSDSISIEPPFNFNELPPIAIDLLNKIIRISDKNNGNIKITNSDPATLKWHNWLVNTINRHTLNTKTLKNGESINNSVVSIIKQIISKPSNQILATDPVEVKEWQTAADNALKNSGKIELPLSSWDMFSMFKQQRDASVGKDDVGIAANGLKSLFALSTYYNDLFRNNWDKVSTPTNNALFLKEFNYYINGKKITKNIVTISDIDITSNQKTLINNAFGKTIDFYKSNAAKNASGFTSAATDNAKELLMAKINASVELSSMHLYMVILGFTPQEIADFMVSDIAERVVNKLDSNIFLTNKSTTVSKILDTISSDLRKEGHKKDSESYVNLAAFKDIYEGAQELKLLARVLGVNQKTSANMQEINKFLSTFEKIIFAREHYLFGEDLGKLFNKEFEESLPKIIDKLLSNNKQYTKERDFMDIANTLRGLRNIPVEFVNEFGVVEKRMVNISGGNFDYRYYINENNTKYREMTKKYYNLIKNTFNIFDIIDSLPHFKNMIKGLSTSHDILLNTTFKYNAMFSLGKDIVENNSYRIKMNSWVKNKMGNKSFSINFGKKEMSRGISWIDSLLTQKWLQTEKPSKLIFNLTDLLKQADVDEFILFTDNKAATTSINEVVDNGFGTLVKKNSESNYIISLDSNYGIANFKRLVENVLLPILQKSSENRVLTESLKVEARKNIFGIYSDTITSTFPLGQLSNPINAERFQKLVNEFNNFDYSKEVEKIVSFNGEKLKWSDIFYVYNLIVNNEKYGDKRLTALLEDYSKDENSLAHDYLMFSSSLDSGQINLFEDDSDTNMIINSFLLYTFNKNGVLDILDNGEQKGLKVFNPDFLIVTDVDFVSKNKKTWKELNEIIKLIKSNGHIIKFEC